MVKSRSDEEAIHETLNYFFTGLDSLDADIIKKAFHPQARSFSMTSRGLCEEPPDHWDRTCAAAKTDPQHPFHNRSREKNIVSLDITGTAAAAKVEWIFSGFMFTDYYNLLKIDGRWYIMGEVYHTTVSDDNE